MQSFSGVVVVGGGVNFLRSALVCDKALTGETLHSADFLFLHIVFIRPFEKTVVLCYTPRRLSVYPFPCNSSYSLRPIELKLGN